MNCHQVRMLTKIQLVAFSKVFCLKLLWVRCSCLTTSRDFHTAVRQMLLLLPALLPVADSNAPHVDSPLLHPVPCASTISCFNPWTHVWFFSFPLSFQWKRFHASFHAKPHVWSFSFLLSLQKDSWHFNKMMFVMFCVTGGHHHFSSFYHHSPPHLICFSLFSVVNFCLLCFSRFHWFPISSL